MRDIDFPQFRPPEGCECTWHLRSGLWYYVTGGGRSCPVHFTRCPHCEGTGRTEKEKENQ